MGPALKRRAYRSKPGRGRRYLFLIGTCVWIFSFGIYVFKTKMDPPRATLFSKWLGEAKDSTETVKSIALLFLTKGHLPLHEIWEMWLDSCVGMVPIAPSTNHCAYENAETESRRNASREKSIADQRLFRIYVHAPPDFPGMRHVKRRLRIV